MSDAVPGLTPPEKPIKLSGGDPKYYKWASPAMRRDKPTEDGALWLDTKVNFLNEIMKFMPRNVLDSLSGHTHSPSGVKNFARKDEFADSVYNEDIFRDSANGLWKGTNSAVQDKIFNGVNDSIDLDGDTGDKEINASRFAGMFGIPFDGEITLGTKDEGRSLSVETESVGEGATKQDVFKLKTTNFKDTSLDYSDAEDDIIPIFDKVAGAEYSKYFKEGVNFNPTIVDMQHTVAMFDGENKDFIVDMDGDGYADNDKDRNWQFDESELATANMHTLTSKSLDTAMYQDMYLDELGIKDPIVNYSSFFSSFMQGSVFNHENLDNVTLRESAKPTYNKIHGFLEGDLDKGFLETKKDEDFWVFLNKLKKEINLEGTDFQYIPNIYEISRGGVDLSDTATWSDKEVFYLSMLMLESRRRYTYAMGSVFGVNSEELDLEKILNQYSNPDIWKYDSKEQLLYIDVKTKSGYQRVYNYYVPEEVGSGLRGAQIVTAKVNWLKRRAIELKSFSLGYNVYQESLTNTVASYGPLQLNRVTGIFEAIAGDLVNAGLSDEILQPLSKVYLDINRVIDRLSPENSSKIDAYFMQNFMSVMQNLLDTVAYTMLQVQPDWISLNKTPKDDSFDAFKEAGYEVAPGGTYGLNNDLADIYNTVDKYKKKILTESANVFNKQIVVNDKSCTYFESVLNTELSLDCYDLNESSPSKYDKGETKDEIIDRVADVLKVAVDVQNEMLTKGKSGAYKSYEGFLAANLGTSASGNTLFSFLENVIDKEARLFYDIKMVDSFNQITYGKALYSYDKNTKESTYLDYPIAYLPQELVSSGTVPSYMSDNKRPIDVYMADANKGVSSTDTNQVDRMYFQMIYTMQKMSTFYMMLPFSSPISGVEADGDEISEYLNAEYNFLTPLREAKKGINSVSEFTEIGFTTEFLGRVNASFSADYVKTRMLGLVNSANFYKISSGLTYQKKYTYQVSGETLDEYKIRVVSGIFGLVPDDFDAGPPLKVSEAGMDKMQGKLFANDTTPIADYLNEIQIGVPAVPLLSDDGTIGFPTGLVDDDTVSVSIPVLNPFSRDKSKAKEAFFATSNHKELGYLNHQSLILGFYHDGVIQEFNPQSAFTARLSSSDSNPQLNLLKDMGIFKAKEDGTGYIFNDVSEYITNDDSGFEAFCDKIISTGNLETYPSINDDTKATFYKPIFDDIMSWSKGIDIAGGDTSIVSSGGFLSKFYKDSFTYTNDDGQIASAKLDIEDYSRKKIEVDTIIQQSLNKDYDAIKSFLDGFYMRMKNLDLGEIGSLSATGDNSALLKKIENPTAGLSLLPDVPFIDYTKMNTENTYKDFGMYSKRYDYVKAVENFGVNTSNNWFDARSAEVTKAGLSSLFVIAPEQIKGKGSSINAWEDIWKAFERMGFIDDNGKIKKVLTMKNFPVIVTENNAVIDLNADQKKSIVTEFKANFLGTYLNDIISESKDIDLNGVFASTNKLSFDVKNSMEQLIYSDEFIKSVDQLEVIFRIFASSDLSLESLPVIGEYLKGAGLDFSRSFGTAQKDRDANKYFKLQEVTADNYNSEIEKIEKSLLYLVNDKWRLNDGFDYTKDSTGAPTSKYYQSIMKSLGSLTKNFVGDAIDGAKLNGTGDGPNFIEYLVHVLDNNKSDTGINVVKERYQHDINAYVADIGSVINVFNNGLSQLPANPSFPFTFDIEFGDGLFRVSGKNIYENTKSFIANWFSMNSGGNISFDSANNKLTVSVTDRSAQINFNATAAANKMIADSNNKKDWVQGCLLKKTVGSESGDLSVQKIDLTSKTITVSGSPPVSAGVVLDFHYYDRDGTSNQNRSLLHEFIRDFIGVPEKNDKNEMVIGNQNYFAVLNLDNPDTKALFESEGLAGVSKGTAPSSYDVLSMAKEHYSNVGYFLESAFNSYSNYRNEILKLLKTGSNSSGVLDATTLEEVVKKRYLDEFYMQGNFSPLIISSEFQSRYRSSAQMFENYSDTIETNQMGAIDQTGWYETRGRFFARGGEEKLLDKRMDFSKMNYSINTDLYNQDKLVGSDSYSKITGKSNKNLRSKRKRKLEDFYGRISANTVDNTLSSTFNIKQSTTLNKEFRTSLTVADLKALNSSIDWEGDKLLGWLKSETVGMFSGSKITALPETEKDFLDKIYTVQTADPDKGSLASFLLTVSGSTYGGEGLSFWKEIYAFLNKKDWYSSRIGKNMNQIHVKTEMNSFFQEASLAGILISIYNDFQNDAYEADSEFYKREKERYQQQKYHEAIMKQRAMKKRMLMKALARRR